MKLHIPPLQVLVYSVLHPGEFEKDRIDYICVPPTGGMPSFNQMLGNLLAAPSVGSIVQIQVMVDEHIIDMGGKKLHDEIRARAPLWFKKIMKAKIDNDGTLDEMLVLWNQERRKQKFPSNEFSKILFDAVRIIQRQRPETCTGK